VIRVILAEDHPVVRVGLERMLGAEPDIDIVATAQDGGEAVEVVDRVECDVVLMDLSMPVKDGVQATREIVEKHGDAVNIVVLTSLSGRDDIMAALDAGASGYLLKDAEPHELLAAIRAAARGDAPLAPRAAREVLSARTEERAEPTLSTRETDVLRLVARGFPNKRIARELQISEKTVKAHLTQVFQRIGVTDRTQAALWARERGVD
jgi:DNA-binding NarL/FixJ family response regulator